MNDLFYLPQALSTSFLNEQMNYAASQDLQQKAIAA